MTTNSRHKPQKHTLYSLCSQSDGGDGCDFAGCKSLLVTEPEDYPLLLLIFPVRKPDQNAIYMLQFQIPVEGGSAVAGDGFRIYLHGLIDYICLVGATLPGQGGLEMIMGNIGGHHLQVSVE